jgi:nucleoside 2-deoxyribosyltransferase
MGYLSGKTVYLCGPIAAATTEEMGTWRESIKPFLYDLGVIVLDPLKKDKEGLGETDEDRQKFRDLIMQEKWAEHKELFWPVARWDLRAVDKSDFIIVNYNPLIPSVGTFHELVNASQQKKPILLKYDRNQLDKFNFWLPVLVKTENFFPTWEQMKESLLQVDKGVYNSSYWTL